MKKIVNLFTAFALFACTSVQTVLATTPITHEKWNALLQKHVSANGCVNYEGFVKDQALLDAYLKELKAHHPSDNWTRNEKYAYWINAYNAFAIKLVVKNYPVKSIKDLGGKLTNKVWDIKFIELGEKTYSLTDIEHNILRPQFKDARVHAAINCASVSCPPLYNKAFEAKTLDKTLDLVFKGFVNDKSRNKISADNPKLSKIFDWFDKDFTQSGKSKIAYINQFSEVKINEKAKIDYLDYDWNLNKCK